MTELTIELVFTVVPISIIGDILAPVGIIKIVVWRPPEVLLLVCVIAF